MVKALKISAYYFKLFRWPNLLVVVLTLVMMRYFVLKPILEHAGFQLMLPVNYFIYIVIATVLISAAGYVINDYFDRKTDLINRPQKVIVGKIIPRRIAILWHWFLTISGVLLGLYVSYKLDLMYLSLIFILVSGTLWFYSTTYKNQFLLGNLIIAILVALVPLILLLYEMPLLVRVHRLDILANNISLKSLVLWIGGYTIFAFVTNLIREIVKDIEDFEGDFVYGRKTIPIVWNVNGAKSIVSLLNSFILVSATYILIANSVQLIAVIYGVVVIILPLIYFQYLLIKANSVIEYHRLSTLLKLVMVLGLGFCVVFHFL